jgi:hypothetical protein
MSSKASDKKSGTQPSAPRGTPARVCVLCRGAIAQDAVAIDIRGLSAHAGCAAYRRRGARR